MKNLVLKNKLPGVSNITLEHIGIGMNLLFLIQCFYKHRHYKFHMHVDEVTGEIKIAATNFLSTTARELEKKLHHIIQSNY